MHPSHFLQKWNPNTHLSTIFSRFPHLHCDVACFTMRVKETLHHARFLTNNTFSLSASATHGTFPDLVDSEDEDSEFGDLGPTHTISLKLTNERPVTCYYYLLHFVGMACTMHTLPRICWPWPCNTYTLVQRTNTIRPVLILNHILRRAWLNHLWQMC